MHAKFRWAVIFLLAASAFSLGWNPSRAQTSEPEARYFPETGHWVAKDFLITYNSIPDPTIIYGFPITEAYQDPSSGRIIQYFEKARFELFPNDPPELRVHLTLLGVTLHKSGEVLPMPENFPVCQFYLETGYQVCYAFLDFFRANGGAAQFGFPISNFEIKDGWIVQYFQRARFEWHPELPSGRRVVLGNLGREYFDVMGENPIRLLPVPLNSPENNIPQPVLSLRVRAFPENAVVPRDGNQTIHVIVQDQNLLPVANARVILVLNLPSGVVKPIEVPAPTDKNGIIKISFPYNDPSIGEAKVLVTAVYQNLQQQTSTSFRIWW